MKFGLANNVIEEIQQVLETNPKIDKGIIFGSRAKGNYKDGSDIDIAIKGANLKLDDILALKVKLDDWNLPYDIDLINYADIKEPALTDHIDRVGIEFYSSWKEYSLDEVFDFASGLSKSVDQFGYGQEFLSFKDIFDNYFIPDELTSLVNSTDKEQESCSIKAGDVFLTRTSETDDELGMSCVALKDYPKATFNGFTKRLRPKGDIEILPVYAGFYFRSPKFRAAVSSMSSVTTRASLNNGMLSQLKITIPPISEQQAIADILISLHNKIDLLRRQNETLEFIADALFRQWFVKEADESWEEKELNDIALHVRDTLTPSTRPNDLYYHYSLPAFDMGKNPIIEPGKEILSNKYKVIENSILVSKLNPKFPRIWAIFRDSIAPNSICSTEFQVLRPTNIIYWSFIYYYLKSPLAINELSGAAGGTSGSHQRVSPADIMQLKFLLPSSDKIEKFDALVKIQFKKIKKNMDEIEMLIQLRDALLPKLLSGEARIKM